MYYILKMLSWLACRFPMKACLKLGNFLGKLTWLVVPEKRKKNGPRKYYSLFAGG